VGAAAAPGSCSWLRPRRPPAGGHARVGRRRRRLAAAHRQRPPARLDLRRSRHYTADGHLLPLAVWLCSCRGARGEPHPWHTTLRSQDTSWTPDLSNRTWKSKCCTGYFEMLSVLHDFFSCGLYVLHIVVMMLAKYCKGAAKILNIVQYY